MLAQLAYEKLSIACMLNSKQTISSTAHQYFGAHLIVFVM